MHGFLIYNFVLEETTMPVYVYHCGKCDFEFEQQQKFSDNPLKKCPQCGQNALHKVYTPVGIIYKGSGFYSTDHRSSSGAVSSTTPKPNGTKPETSSKKESDDKKENKKNEKIKKSETS